MAKLLKKENSYSLQVFINRYDGFKLKNNIIYSIYKQKDNKKGKNGNIVRVRINRNRDIIVVGHKNNNLGIITCNEFKELSKNEFYDRCITLQSLSSGCVNAENIELVKTNLDIFKSMLHDFIVIKDNKLKANSMILYNSFNRNIIDYLKVNHLKSNNFDDIVCELMDNVTWDNKGWYRALKEFVGHIIANNSDLDMFKCKSKIENKYTKAKYEKSNKVTKDNKIWFRDNAKYIFEYIAIVHNLFTTSYAELLKSIKNAKQYANLIENYVSYTAYKRQNRVIETYSITIEKYNYFLTCAIRLVSMVSGLRISEICNLRWQDLTIINDGRRVYGFYLPIENKTNNSNLLACGFVLNAILRSMQNVRIGMFDLKTAFKDDRFKLSKESNTDYIFNTFYTKANSVVKLGVMQANIDKRLKDFDMNVGKDILCNFEKLHDGKDDFNHRYRHFYISFLGSLGLEANAHEKVGHKRANAYVNAYSGGLSGSNGLILGFEASFIFELIFFNYTKVDIRGFVSLFDYYFNVFKHCNYPLNTIVSLLSVFSLQVDTILKGIGIDMKILFEAETSTLYTHLGYFDMNFVFTNGVRNIDTKYYCNEYSN